MFGISRIGRDEGGNVLAMAGVALPLMIGFVGLATDTIQWTLDKRELQRIADSAALAGAYAIAQDLDPVASAERSIDANNYLEFTSDPEINNAPADGAYEGDDNAITVNLVTRRRLPFSGIFMDVAPQISARATASMLVNGNYCVISLDTGTDVGIVSSGTPTVNLDCGMFANSRAANAVDVNGSSELNTTLVGAVGGLTPNSLYGDAVLIPFAVAQPDPFEDLPTPNVSGCGAKLSVNPGQTKNFSPGCYKGIDIKGTANFSPGTYFVDGSSVSFGSQAIVNGAGVTFVLTSATASSNPSSIATLSINGGATLNLSSPTSGTYSGVLFFQDRRAPKTGTVKINGNSSSVLEGAIYFPSKEIEFTGTSGMTTDCVQLVGFRVKFSGTTTITNECPLNGADAFRGAVIRLVE